MSDSLLLHGLQHARLPCPSSTGACSNSCPLSQWCLRTISSSVVPFSSCPQSFPASVSFPKSWLFTSNGQSIGASASASVLPMNIQDWFPLGFTGLISLQSKGPSRVFSSTTVQKHQFFSTQPSLWSNSLMTTIALTGQTFVSKVMSLLLNMLSRFVIAFIPRSKHLLVSSLQSPSLGLGFPAWATGSWTVGQADLWDFLWPESTSGYPGTGPWSILLHL